MESLIILLIDLLKKNSIKIPECIQIKKYLPTQSTDNEGFSTDLTASSVEFHSFESSVKTVSPNTVTPQPLLPTNNTPIVKNLNVDPLILQPHENLRKVSFAEAAADIPAVSQPIGPIEMQCQLQTFVDILPQNSCSNGSKTIVSISQSTQPFATSQLTQPAATSESTQLVATSQPIQPVATSQPIQLVAASQHTQPAATSQPITTSQSIQQKAILSSTLRNTTSTVSDNNRNHNNTEKKNPKNSSNGLHVLRFLSLDSGKHAAADLWRPVESLLNPLSLNEIKTTSAIQLDKNKGTHRVATSDLVAIAQPNHTTVSKNTSCLTITAKSIDGVPVNGSSKIKARKDLVSPIQSFGIDNILVSSNLPADVPEVTQCDTSHDSNISTTNSSSTQKLCNNSNVQRSRISSSGHTVAALLDAAHGCEIQLSKKKHQSNTTQRKCRVGSMGISKSSSISSETTSLKSTNAAVMKNVTPRPKSSISTRSSRRTVPACGFHVKF